MIIKCVNPHNGYVMFWKKEIPIIWFFFKRFREVNKRKREKPLLTSEIFAPQFMMLVSRRLLSMIYNLIQTVQENKWIWIFISGNETRWEERGREREIKYRLLLQTLKWRLMIWNLVTAAVPGDDVTTKWTEEKMIIGVIITRNNKMIIMSGFPLISRFSLPLTTSFFLLPRTDFDLQWVLSPDFFRVVRVALPSPSSYPLFSSHLPFPDFPVSRDSFFSFSFLSIDFSSCYFAIFCSLSFRLLSAFLPKTKPGK